MLRFDSKLAVEGLKLAIFEECSALTDWLWTQVQGKAPPEVDRSKIEKAVVMTAGQVIGTVSAAGIGALTTEWGSGSLADESNPMWQEYTESRYYNPSRYPHGHPISGRPKGSYINLDGETKVSTGRMEGLNLERFLKPMEPQHWLQEVVNLSRPYILERLAQTIKAFPLHHYFIESR